MFKSIETFTDDAGKIVAWPSKRRTQHQMALLDAVLHSFESGRVYSENEVQTILTSRAETELVPTLLQELLEGDYLEQDERGYWRADGRPTGANTPTDDQS